MKKLLFIVLILAFPTLLFAGTYYVSATGSANWATCEDTPASPCSVSTANSNASAGDIINLQDDDGSYADASAYTIGGYSGGDPIVGSGSEGSWIVWQAEGYGGGSPDTPVINSTQYGVFLNGKAYHHFKGITFNINANKFISLQEDTGGVDTNHIIFEGCTFVGLNDEESAIRTDYAINNFVLKDNIYSGTNVNEQTLYNWVFISSGTGKTVEKLLFDGNTCGTALSHECIGIYSTTGDSTTKIIIRNNTLENQLHTALNIYANSGNPTNVLVENNILKNSGTLCDEDANLANCDGVGEWNGLYDNGSDPDQARERKTAHTNASNESIVRYNEFYKNGVAMQVNGKPGTVTDKYIYNNTFYKNCNAFRIEDIGVGYAVENQWLINNLFRDNTETTDAWTNLSIDIDLGSGRNSLLYFQYNFADEGAVESDYGGTIGSLNDLDSSPGSPAFVSNEEGTASFVNEGAYDFTLQSGSGAINAGGPLTLVNDSGGGSGTSLVVDDATPFHDGSWCPDSDTLTQSGLTCQADFICVGDTSTCSQISSISTNTITLASSLTWDDNDPVYLYKDSDGTIVLYGSAPDMGAYEYEASCTNCGVTIN